MSYRTSILIVIFAFSISACSPLLYTKTPDRHAFDPITEFRSDNTVRIYNNQPSMSEIVYYHSARGRSGNFHVWTDVAIEIAARELRKRGLTISDDAPRGLGLKVLYAQTNTTFTTFETVIDIEATRDDGSRKRYRGRNKSVMAANLARQTDGALMRAVAAMLNDPDLVAYLTE